MNKYDFMSLESLSDEIGTAWLEHRYEDVIPLINELIQTAENIRYALGVLDEV